jgi:hypothetical protein
MVEANHNVQQAQLHARLAQATITLGHREAEKAVERVRCGTRRRALRDSE